MKKLLFSIIILFVLSAASYGQSITMCTMNLQHAQGTDENFNYQRQVDEIDDCDLVAVQEKGTSDTGWNTALTNAGMSQVVYRENSTLADGNAVWVKNSTITLHGTNSTVLSDGFVGTGGVDVDKSIACADVTFNGKRFWFCSTHKCWSACSDSQRTDQTNTALSWIATNLGTNVIVLGDMNFIPSSTQATLYKVNYIDLWQYGIDNSIAFAPWDDRDSSGQGDMPVDSNSITHDTRRIDFGWKHKEFVGLHLTSVTMPDTRAICPHGLVANGGSLPACTPEVKQLWDVTGDFGVKPTDHNIIKFVFSSSPKKCRFHTFPSCQ